MKRKDRKVEPAAGRLHWRKGSHAVLPAVAFALVCSAHAPVDQGTISGTVTDASGAVIPNASVTLTNVETGLVLRATSKDAGEFVFHPSRLATIV